MSRPDLSEKTLCPVCYAIIPTRFEGKHREWHRTLSNIPK